VILSISELQEFNELHNQTILDALFVEAAGGIVEDYLGFPVEAADYPGREYSGDNSRVLFLGYQPIQGVSEILINGEPVADLSELKLGDSWIYLPSGFSRGVMNIAVSFRAGYEEGEIPAVMKLTALRIAGILAKESGGNIGINSVTDPASGSRTYQEIKFGKYLSLLAKYRITYRDR